MKHAFKKIMAFIMVLAMVIGILPSVFAAYVGPFTDVADTSWYAPYVEYVHDNGLMVGMTATTFAPNKYLTRAETAAVIYRLAGSPEVSEPATFTDLTQNWYKKAIAWAEDEAVVAGIGDGTFNPNGLVTREQLVSMLWRYYGCPEVEGDPVAAYPDADKVAAYARDALNWALTANVLSGIPHGSVNYLEPKGNATRAQYARIIACLNCHEFEDGACIICGETLADANEIVILYTNDVHTYIDKDLSYDHIADLKDQTAAVAAGVLLVDAGDHIQGTAYGSMDKGETIIDLMNAADYDLATLGNHEFDYGMERALELVEKAEFPYVSANFYHEAEGVRGANVLDAFKIFELDGKKIAIVGVTTPESFTKSTPKYFQDENGNYIYGISGGDDGTALYADVQAAIDAAKAEGADYVIALGHCGDDPASQPWTSEEVIANTAGLDAFIDGHSHSTVEYKEVTDKDGNAVVLTQTGEYFNAIGRMSITADGIKTTLLTEAVGSDEDVKEIKDAWIAELDELLGEKIAYNNVDFRIYGDAGRLIRKQETNLGDFTADALYYLFDVTEGLDVDLAIMNGGGIRADMPVGDVSYNTTKTVHTFGNVACLMTVTGQQILDALEWGAKNVGAGENGGFLHVSGVTYEIHSYIPSTVQADEKGVWIGGPTGEYRVKNVTIGGEPLDLTATYNMAGYNYTLRDLGDGFAMFGGAALVKDYVMEDYLVLANYAQSFPAVDGVPTIEADNSVLGANYGDINGEGRIIIVTESTAPSTDGIGVPSTHREGVNIPTFVTTPAAYDESGSYPLVVMIHGHGGNHNEWGGYDAISNALADNGIMVVTLDFPGCGDSTESFQLNTMTNMKNDVLDVLNYMTENYAVDADKVGAFGYSMGGRIVLEMIAEDMYDFAAIELVAPGEDTEDLKDLFGGADAWETMKAAANESGYVEFTTVYGQHQELSKEWFADLEKYSDGLVELAAPKYTGESLVIWGIHDAAVRPHVSAAVAETLGAAVLNTYDAGGHSYSFYAANEYTVPVVNDGSVNFLTEELLDTEHRIHGYVSDITDYGNLNLTIPDSALTEAGFTYGEMLVVTVNGTEYMLPYHDSFYDVEEGEALLNGYNGTLSLAIRMGDFATTNGYATNEEGNWYYADPTALPLFVTIEDVETATCEHNYVAEGEEPTCVDDGYMTYTCSICGDSYTELLDATGVHVDEDGDCFCDHCGIVVGSGEIDLEGKAFVKVTTAPTDWSGIYLIVSEGSNVALDGSLSALDAGHNVIEVEIVDSKIAANEDTVASIFAINAVDGGYSIKSASELYIGGSADGNKLATSSDDAFVNTIALNGGNADISNSGKYLRFYSSTGETAYRFRYYAEGAQQPVQLYLLTDADTVVPDPEPTPEPETVEYTLTNALKDGDKVIIVNAETSKAMSSEIVSTYYKAGVDVTPADGKIVTAETAIVWTVVADGNGFNLVNADGNKVSIDGTYNSIPYDKTNDAWTVAAAATENCVYVVNENGKYLQWSSYGNFSAYGYNADSESTFAMQVYAAAAADEGETTDAYVAIYNPAKGKVMTTEASVYNSKDQLKSADATLADDKLTTDATNVALFKMTTVDGVTTFQTEDGKYLYADGTHVRLMDEAGDYTAFVLEEVEGGYYIKCATANYNGKAQYIEFYSNVFTVYGMGTDTTIYTFAFYELAETEPTPDPEPEPEPTPDPETYGLVGELKDGDKVLVYNPGSGKALSSTASGYNLAGVDVTVADSTITTADTTIVWTVTKNEDGTYTFTQGEDVTLAVEVSGSYFNIKTTAAEGYTTGWVLTAMESETYTDLFDVTASGLEGSYGPVFLEYYNGFKAYSTGRTSSYYTEAAMGLQFYALGAEPVTPDPEPTPDPETGLTATALADIEATDKVLIVMHAAFTDKDYALLNNANKGPAAVFDGTTHDETMYWTVTAVEGGYHITVAGAETTTYLYTSNANNGMGLTTAPEAGYLWSLDESGYLKTTDSAGNVRYLGVYDNNNNAAVDTPNFRAYKNTTGNTKDQTLTFYVVPETTTEPTPDPEPEPTPEPDTYTLAGELKDGDKVLVYNPGSGKALSSTASGYNLAGVDVTVEESAIATADETIVWTVTKNESGTYTLTQGEDVTLAVEVSGSYFNIKTTAAEGYTTEWVLTAMESETYTDLFDVTASGLEGSYGPVFLEYYNGFKAYSTGRTSSYYTEAAMGLQFYVLTEETETPVDPEPTGYTYTLHFSNPNSWSNVNGYGWISGGTYFTSAWPGNALTADAEHTGWYTVEFNVDSASVCYIFNDGSGNQTSDLTVNVPDGATSVEAWITGVTAGDVVYNAPASWTGGEETVYTYTVHFFKQDGWNGVNGYSWDGAGNPTNGTWPGTALEENADHSGWYTLELTSTAASANVIFNDGTNQTADLSIAVPAGETAVEAWVSGTAATDVSYTAPEGWEGTATEPTYTLVATALADIKATDRVLIVTTVGDTSYVMLNNATKGPAAVFDGQTWDDTMLWNIAAVSGGYTIYVNGSTTQWLYGINDNNGVRIGDTTTGSVFNFAVPCEGQSSYLTYTDPAGNARYVGVYTTTPNFRGYKLSSSGTLANNIADQTTTFYVVTEVAGG